MDEYHVSPAREGFVGLSERKLKRKQDSGEGVGFDKLRTP